MRLNKYRGRILFCSLSFLGIFIFFVPVSYGQIPLLFLINLVKNFFVTKSQLIVLLFSLDLLVSLILGKLYRIEYFAQKHKKDYPFEIILYFFSFGCQLIIFWNPECPLLSDDNIGGQVFELAYSVMITIIMSGFFVVFIMKSGIVDFISCLVEPMMRKLFRLPGSAAVDCLSSFVSSASVGIYITSGLYEDKLYTEREACTVVTCFSVMSLGFMFVLTEMAGIPHLTTTVVIASFIIMIVLAIICARIPPLSKKRDVYINGEARQNIPPERMISMRERFRLALTLGDKRAELFQLKFLLDFFYNSILFAQKIIVIMIPLMVIVMSLATYTPLFEYMGKIFEPLLYMMRLPNIDQIAPATIIGITEVTLPVISIIGLEIETKSVFFVVVLSIVQIVYLTESASAILSSSIPLNFEELVMVFFIRTLIAIPLVAIAAHLVGVSML